MYEAVDYTPSRLLPGASSVTVRQFMAHHEGMSLLALAWLLLDVDARTAILLGAVVSSTDAAAVFAVMRRLPLRARTRASLEAESGFNDPPVIILVTLVVSDMWHDLNPVTAVLGFLQQMLVGAVVGFAVAIVGRWVLSHLALPATGLYPLATLAFAMLGFGAAGVAGGSPFVAVYVAGLLLGNAGLPHHKRNPRLCRRPRLAVPDRALRGPRPAGLTGPAG